MEGDIGMEALGMEGGISMEALGMEGGIGMEALGMEDSIGMRSDEFPILRRRNLHIESLFFYRCR